MFEDRGKIAQKFATGLKPLFRANSKMTPIAALDPIAAFIAGRVALKIDRSFAWAKPNAPATIEKKGFDYPLHETDRMRRAVSGAVRRGRTAKSSIVVQREVP